MRKHRDAAANRPTPGPGAKGVRHAGASGKGWTTHQREGRWLVAWRGLEPSPSRAAVRAGVPCHAKQKPPVKAVMIERPSADRSAVRTALGGNQSVGAGQPSWHLVRIAKGIPLQHTPSAAPPACRSIAYGFSSNPLTRNLKPLAVRRTRYRLIPGLSPASPSPTGTPLSAHRG